VRMDKKRDAVEMSARLGDFDSDGEPPSGYWMEFLCEDHNGTYVLPFPCLWVDGVWRRPDPTTALTPRSLGGEGNELRSPGDAVG
jgi:hypothetical protein